MYLHKMSVYSRLWINGVALPKRDPVYHLGSIASSVRDDFVPVQKVSPPPKQQMEYGIHSKTSPGGVKQIKRLSKHFYVLCSEGHLIMKW